MIRPAFIPPSNPLIVGMGKKEECKTAPVIDPAILAAFAQAREERKAIEAAQKKAEKEDKRKCRALSKMASASSSEAIAKRGPGRPKGSKNAHSNEKAKEPKTIEQRMTIALLPIPEVAMSVETFLLVCAKGYVGIPGQPGFKEYGVEQLFCESRAILRGNREFDYVAPMIAQGIMTYANGVDIARRLIQSKKASSVVTIDELRKMGLVRSVELPKEQASPEAFALAKETVKAFGIKEYDPKTEVMDAIVCKSAHAGFMPGVDSDARSGHNYKTAQETLVRLMQDSLNKSR